MLWCAAQMPLQTRKTCDPGCCEDGQQPAIFRDCLSHEAPVPLSPLSQTERPSPLAPTRHSSEGASILQSFPWISWSDLAPQISQLPDLASSLSFHLKALVKLDLSFLKPASSSVFPFLLGGTAFIWVWKVLTIWKIFLSSTPYASWSTDFSHLFLHNVSHSCASFDFSQFRRSLLHLHNCNNHPPYLQLCPFHLFCTQQPGIPPKPISNYICIYAWAEPSVRLLVLFTSTSGSPASGIW